MSEQTATPAFKPKKSVALSGTAASRTSRSHRSCTTAGSAPPAALTACTKRPHSTPPPRTIARASQAQRPVRRDAERPAWTIARASEWVASGVRMPSGMAIAASRSAWASISTRVCTRSGRPERWTKLLPAGRNSPPARAAAIRVASSARISMSWA